MSSEKNAHVATKELVEALYLWLRGALLYADKHPALAAFADAVAEKVQAAAPPVTIQFVGGGLFRDRRLVPLALAEYTRVRWVAEWLAAPRVHELTFEATLSRDELALFHKTALRAAAGGGELLDELQLDGMRWREIKHAGWGADGQSVDPEVFASAQVALALRDVAVLQQTPGSWNAESGSAILKRAERAIATQKAATMRTLELLPEAWTPARRALSATVTLLIVASDLKVNRASMRALAHALFACALHGYEKGEPLQVREAATLALRAALHTSEVSAGLRSHWLATLAALRLIAEGEESSLSELPRILYGLEGIRSAGEGDFALTRLDLLAHLVSEAPTSAWTRILVLSAGTVPPGARVKLADGRYGIAMGPGVVTDPWRPEVLVEGVRLIPEEPVELALAQA
jgi:hypothetical protein